MRVSTVFFVLALICGCLGAAMLRDYYRTPTGEAGPVAGTETWTVEEVDALRQGNVEIFGDRVFRRRVSVVAAAQPGPDGLVTTPDGGVECVWWRHETVRYFNERVDGKLVRSVERSGGVSSRTPFALVDATGRLLVWPDGATVTGASIVYRKVVKHKAEAAESAWSHFMDLDTTTAVETVEYGFRPGDRVYVHGEAHDQLAGGLAIGKAADQGPFLIAAQVSERRLRERVGRRAQAIEGDFLRGWGLVFLAVLFFAAMYVV